MGRVTKVVTFGSRSSRSSRCSRGLVHISSSTQHHVEKPARGSSRQGQPSKREDHRGPTGERRRLSLSSEAASRDTDPVQPRGDGGESCNAAAGPTIDLYEEVFPRSRVYSDRGPRPTRRPGRREDTVVEKHAVEDAAVEDHSGRGADRRSPSRMPSKEDAVGRGRRDGCRALRQAEESIRRRARARKSHDAAPVAEPEASATERVTRRSAGSDHRRGSERARGRSVEGVRASRAATVSSDGDRATTCSAVPRCRDAIGARMDGARVSSHPTVSRPGGARGTVVFQRPRRHWARLEGASPTRSLGRVNLQWRDSVAKLTDAPASAMTPRCRCSTRPGARPDSDKVVGIFQAAVRSCVRSTLKRS